MTAGDARLDAIQERLERFEHVRQWGSSDTLHEELSADVAYLLAELRKAHEALARVEALAAAWTARGEHDMAFSKTVPDEDIAMVLLTEGASMVENGRHIRVAMASAVAGHAECEDCGKCRAVGNEEWCGVCDYRSCERGPDCKDAAVAAAKGEQAYIVECEDLVPGDQIWFKNLTEAEETCGPFPSCCVPKPVGPDYDGPRWVPEDEESE